MFNYRKSIFIVILAVFAFFFWTHESRVTYGPGVLVPDEPVQKKLSGQPSFSLDQYSITPLAEFSISARVLSMNWYRFGDDADIVPLDLALGWGEMSDEKVLEKISVTQSDRKYFWRSDDLPISRSRIISSSANMHIIPAGDEVLRTLKKIRKGSLISLSGYLVKLENQDGRIWTSSLSRTDSGNNSCELIYVEKASIL